MSNNNNLYQAGHNMSGYLYEEEYMSCPAFWFGTYHVRITPEELNFGYTLGCAQKTVNISEIRKVTVLEWQDPLCNWGGWGIRWMIYPHREVGYVPRNGPAIRLEIPAKDGSEYNEIYVFICSDPEKVKQMLMNPSGKAAPPGKDDAPHNMYQAGNNDP